ncbi:DUF1559 family PulG-like putative transporter [Aquisphaera insulae]|uniref:DUF1559 family PulG-like putative transporter n=1 Tax=Aquisphaera insulae TaxID=2712864 RepID=UPI0013EDF17C|nr:DUF1559 domain-containing protein [Aquisphaera insulae]
MRVQGRRGITLVEALVLVSIAGVGVLLLIPAVQTARAAARRASCILNLQMIGLALHNYTSANDALPPSDVRGPGRANGTGFLVRILPYMEMAPIYNGFNFVLEPWDLSNATTTETRLDAFICPDNPRTRNVSAAELHLDGLASKTAFGPAHYAANWGGGRDRWGRDFAAGKGTYLGVMMTILTPDGEVKAPDGKPRARSVSLRDIVDGAANTLAVAEKEESLGWAVGGFAASEFDVDTKPKNDDDSTLARRVYTGSPHRAGIYAAMCDGSVRLVDARMDRALWYALMTRAGGEAVAAKPAGLSETLSVSRDQSAESRDRPRLAAESAEKLVKRLIEKPIGDTAAVNGSSVSIRVVDLQTGDAARIVAPLSPERNACRFPAWSTDGRHIYFCVSRGDHREVAEICDLEWTGDGVRLRELGPGLAPSPSPAGDRILFHLQRESPEPAGVWIMTSDGLGRRRLGGEGRPRWSPDGRQFLICRQEDSTVTLIDERPDRSSGEIGLKDRTIFSQPSWAGEETIVAALGDASGSVADCIALVSVPASDRAAVSKVLWKKGEGLDAVPWSPVFDPGSGRCVFIASEGRGGSLYLIDPAKPQPQAPVRLEKAGNVMVGMTPSLSADGRFVIYANQD